MTYQGAPWVGVSPLGGRRLQHGRRPEAREEPRLVRDEAERACRRQHDGCLHYRRNEGNDTHGAE